MRDEGFTNAYLVAKELSWQERDKGRGEEGEDEVEAAVAKIRARDKVLVSHRVILKGPLLLEPLHKLDQVPKGGVGVEDRGSATNQRGEAVPVKDLNSG